MATVEDFLKKIGVREHHVEAAARVLRNAGYDNETYLLKAQRESLQAIGVAFPVIDLLFDHQKHQEQQRLVAANTNALQQGDNLLELDKAMARLALTKTPATTRLWPPSNTLRKATCRLWVGGDCTLYSLNASSFQALNQAVRSNYMLEDEEYVSLYYILDKDCVESRRYVSNDHDLNKFFNLAGNPIIFIWLRGESSISPGSLPSEIEIKVASASSSQSSVSDRTRGYAQTLFRNGVRERDDFTCVLSGKKLRPKANNVQAAHIIGVEPGMATTRKAAGVVNAYDTWNGMLLETSLNSAFDSFLWCMDEFCVVHVSDIGKEQGLGEWEGKRVKLKVDQPLYPSRKLLRSRFQLYKEKRVQPKPAPGGRRKYGVQTI